MVINHPIQSALIKPEPQTMQCILQTSEITANYMAPNGEKLNIAKLFLLKIISRGTNPGASATEFHVHARIRVGAVVNDIPWLKPTPPLNTGGDRRVRETRVRGKG